MLRFWMLRTFDALIVTPMRGSFLPRSYRSIHQARGVFSTVLLKSVAVCFYACGRCPDRKPSPSGGSIYRAPKRLEPGLEPGAG